jgi:DNA invertase Pin-like site-specific DNA recombinase
MYNKEYAKLLPEEILVYLRRSRSDDPSMTVEEVLEKHEAKLREWMDANLDSHVPEENWYREVASGETIQDRPEFQKILKRIESDKIKAVLCVDCARISRGDLEECGRTIKLFRFTSTLVITLYRSYDLRDEFEREGFERELKNGNYYLEYSKKLMRRGKEYAVSMGAFVASVPPYGYELTRVQVGKKKLPSLRIVEEKAKVVRMIFDWYVNEDMGCQRIASRLNDMGIKPMRIDVWNPISIRKILSNEHYIGKIKYFAHKIDYIVQNQEVTKKRIAIKDSQLCDGMHDPIVDEDIFYKAKAKNSKNPKIKYGTTMRNPLSSLLYCECGHAMTFRINGNLPRFECPYQRVCHNASANANELMQEVTKALQESLDDFSVDVCSSNDEAIKRQEEKIAYLEKRLKDVEYKELALWEKYTEDNMPKSVFDSLRGKYEAEKADVENLLRVAVNEMPQKIDFEERTERFHDALEALNNDSVSIESKNKLLRACIDRIDYKRETAYRVPKEEQEEGKTYVRGWYQSEPVLDIHLKL